MLNPEKFNPVTSLDALVEAAYKDPELPFIWVETPFAYTHDNGCLSEEGWQVRYFPADDNEEFGIFTVNGIDALGGYLCDDHSLLIRGRYLKADWLIAPNGAALPVRTNEVYGLVGSRVKVMTGNPSPRRSQEQLNWEARVAAALMGYYTHESITGQVVRVAKVRECFMDLDIQNITLG